MNDFEKAIRERFERQDQRREERHRETGAMIGFALGLIAAEVAVLLALGWWMR